MPSGSGKVYATLFMSSTSPSSGRGFPSLLVNSGWYLYVSGFAYNVFNTIKADEILFHNPFGYNGVGAFSFHQYLECREDPAVSSVADVTKFGDAMSLIYSGLNKKPYCYLGVVPNVMYTYDIFKMGRFMAQSLRPFSRVNDKVDIIVDVFGAYGKVPFDRTSSGYIENEFEYAPYTLCRFMQNTFSKVGCEPQSVSGSPWAAVSWAPNYSTASFFEANYADFDPASRIKGDLLIQPDSEIYHTYSRIMSWLSSGFGYVADATYIFGTLKKTCDEIKRGEFLPNFGVVRNSVHNSHIFSINHSPGVPVNLTSQTVNMTVKATNSSGPTAFVTGCTLSAPNTSGRISFSYTAGVTNAMTSGVYHYKITATSGATNTDHLSGYIYMSN